MSSFSVRCRTSALVSCALFAPTVSAKAQVSPPVPPVQAPQQPPAPAGGLAQPQLQRLGAGDTAAAAAAAMAARKGRDSVLLDSIAKGLKDDRTRDAILSVLRSRSAATAEIDNGFTVFGVDVFRRETSLFDPNDAGPVPADYRVGPGDELALVLTGDIEQTYQLSVTREGSIFIPNIGAVQVASLSMKQLDDVLFSRLSRVYSGMTKGPGATAHFTVTVANLGTNQVSVLGNVRTPGAYRISKLGNVLTALYTAGGPTDDGSLRQVRVIRAGTPIASIDLYDYLISGSTANASRLQSGDVVLVPPRGPQIRLAGPVLRPATYELVPGENLGELIRMAGGFRPEADRRRLQIERVVPPQRRTAVGMDRELFEVTAPSLETSREPMADGDAVHVLTISVRVANRVRITGNVWNPGAVALIPGMRLSDAIARTGGLKTDTYEGLLQVSRLMPDETRRLMRVRIPGRAAAEPSDADIIKEDIQLQPDDEVRVFSLTEYRSPSYVTIGGAVKSGGQIPFVEGMTLRSLVMLAGGLEEGALLNEAELARMPTDRTKGATAVTTRVPLDSTYLFDRKPGSPYTAAPGIAAAANAAPEVPLKPYDNILIFKQPDWILPRTVSIVGEVRFPGQYALRTKSERLSDVIERAGGLTSEAYPEGINFSRSKGGVGRIGVDLPLALRDRSSPDNMLLIDGDNIEIPFRSAVVRIVGAVNSPSTVPYIRGADLAYYVNAAGGATATANEKKIFVMQANGKVEGRRGRLFWTSSPTPEPGSTVSVPERIAGSRFDPAALLAATTSILSSAVAIVAIVRSTK